MKVSGFTFIRNGTLLGYPYIESIKSILPIVDEFIVNVGNSDDDTLERIKGIGDPKIRIIESVWNENMTDRGFVYAQQTMIALYNCTGDWAFYIQGDEVVHENDLPNIKAAFEKAHADDRVEGLVFDYYHFFGAIDTIAISPAWYRREVRAVRNNIRTFLPSDAQFFLVMEKNRRGRYPRVIPANAHIYHYGHVRPAAAMQEKMAQVSKYWGHRPPDFRKYSIDPKAITRFEGSHPTILNSWIEEFAEKSFQPPGSYHPSKRERRHRLAMKIEKLLGTQFGKKHFKIVG